MNHKNKNKFTSMKARRLSDKRYISRQRYSFGGGRGSGVVNRGVLPGINRAQDTTCGHKAEDITPSIAWRRGIERGSARRSSSRTRTRKLYFPRIVVQVHLDLSNNQSLLNYSISETWRNNYMKTKNKNKQQQKTLQTRLIFKHDKQYTNK